MMVDNPQAGLKDRKLQDYYESLLAMYSSKGWDYHTEDVKELVERGNTLAGITSLEDLHFRRGQIDAFMKMLAQPVVVKAAYDLLLEGDADESAV